MRVLVLGSGGREDAIEWSLARSGDPQREVFVAPGNAGSGRRLAVDVTAPGDVVDVCRREHIDLVIVGPESALGAGVTDALRAAGITVFGPSMAAARLETSKIHCREFAGRHAIPGPRWAAFGGADAAAVAVTWADTLGSEVVVKADGLMAGKGVVVPATRDERDRAIAAAAEGGGPFLLEERMTGEEVSLLVFCDGHTVRAMPAARDHKRIHEADRGPNTGGMGAYAPTCFCPPDVEEQILREIVMPAVRGLAAEGNPYVGVLYAGVMLTAAGPLLVEFNCRFGDPEAQVILPLLETDLLDVVTACCAGRLDEVAVAWSDQVSCAVVIAAPGYPARPETGAVIHGLDEAGAEHGVTVFHSGTDSRDGETVTSGGRVLTVTAVGADLRAARQLALRGVGHVSFPGAVHRRDIGWRELARTTGGYAASGVNVEEGNRAVALMKRKIESTHTPAVMSGVGAFGGAIGFVQAASMKEPVLVASTDGVGTKVMVAAESGSCATLGHDIVNHCVNDILVQRATPLFFLDYFAASSLSAPLVAEIVGGMADACRENNCVLLGGETAEMPGVYHDGHFDIAGTMVGVVERDRLLPRPDVVPGDVLIGIASSGLHTNGYSLARRIFEGLPLDACPPGMAVTLAEALLAPHRSYLGVLAPLLGTDLVKALVHVTGGGFIENIPRVLPADTDAVVNLCSWRTLPVFEVMRAVSGLEEQELHRTFNMGIGMIVVVSRADAEAARGLIGEETWVIGQVTPGTGKVHLA